MDRLLTSGALAKELGVSREGFNHWVRQGLITAAFTTPGGHRRYDPAEVRDQVAAMRRIPAASSPVTDPPESTSETPDATTKQPETPQPAPASEEREKAQVRPSEDELRARATELYSDIWHKDLFKQALTEARAANKTGKVALSRVITGFLEPVLALQAKYDDPPLLKYALEQTLSGNVLKSPSPRWYRYTDAVCKRNAHNFAARGERDPKAVRTAKGDKDLIAKEAEATALLQRAGDLNNHGQTEEAHEVLDELLDLVEDLAPLFGNSQQLTEASLRQAFKQGRTNFVGIRPPRLPGIDFSPDWTWPEGLRTLDEAAEAALAEAG